MNIKTLFNHTIEMRRSRQNNDLASFKKAFKQYVSAAIFLKLLEKTWFSYTMATVLFLQKSEFLKQINQKIDGQSSIEDIMSLQSLHSLSSFNVYQEIEAQENSQNSLDLFLQKYNSLHNTSYGHPSNTHFFFDLISSAEIKVLSICLVIIGLMSTIHIMFSAITITIGLLGILVNIVMLSQRQPPVVSNRQAIPPPVPVEEDGNDDFKRPIYLDQEIPLEAYIDGDQEILGMIRPLFTDKNPQSIAQIVTLSERFLCHKENLTDPTNRARYQTEKQLLIATNIIDAQGIESMESTLTPLILMRKKCRVQSVFPSITETDLNSTVNNPQKYLAVITHEKDIFLLNQLFLYLTQTQSGGNPMPRLVAEHHAQQGSCSKLDSNFSITVGSRFQGYTVHCFLHTARNYLSETETPYTTYKGELEFSFSYSEFTKVLSFLKDLTEWYQKATSMLHALFGEDATPYISTGIKPFSEIYIAELQRSRKFIDQNTLAEMNRESNPDQKIQLIEQITLNLSAHHFKDEYRELLEHFYSISDLKDNKGDAKTFMRAPGAEYTSMLSTVNLKAIAAHLMYHAIIETKAREMGCCSLTDVFYNGFTIPPDPNNPNLEYIENTDFKKTFYAYTLVCLSEIGGQILKIHTPTMLFTDSQQRMTRYRTKLQRVNPNNYHELRETLVESIESMLDMYFNVTLNSLVPKELMTEEKIKNFLVEATRNRRRQHSEHYPVSPEEIDALMLKIQASEAYAAAIANGTFVDVSRGETSKIKHLATAIKQRMSNFHPGMQVNQIVNFYAPEQLIPGLDAFAKIAYKICHAERLDIHTKTLESFWQAISHNESDQEFFSTAFCNAGFSGRLQFIEEQLPLTLSDPIYQTALFLRTSLSQTLFMDVLRETDPTQTAHNYPQSENINIELGLTNGQPSNAAPHSAIRDKFFNKFAQDYLPSKLYDQCYQELITAFQECQTKNDDPGLYRIFKTLETNYDSAVVTEEDTRTFQRKYKVISDDERSPWSIAKFLDNLPSALINSLIARNLIMRAERPELTVRFTSGHTETYARIKTDLALCQQDEPLHAPVHQFPHRELAEAGGGGGNAQFGMYRPPQPPPLQGVPIAGGARAVEARQANKKAIQKSVDEAVKTTTNDNYESADARGPG